MPITAWAGEKPPELNQAIHAATPTGSATLRKFMLHVYDASFWSDTNSWQKAPYALSITYAMDFSAKDLSERTLSEMQRVSDAPEANLRSYAAKLSNLWPDVKEGDRITALARVDGSTLFFHNGRQLGAIADNIFTSAFFGIWLSPKTSEPTMRKQLLNPSGE
ncbi:MAG: chalcone isomerase family protein [Rickettsiales bacterium]